jgi:hypothetical protein
MSPLKTVEQRKKELERRITRLEDVKQIEKLQGMYGFYLGGGGHSKIVDQFSDNCISAEVSDHGVFLGKAGVRRLFTEFFGRRRPGMENAPKRIAVVMQLQGVIDIDADGKRAKGRFRAIELAARPVIGDVRIQWGHGIYDNEYIKENGKWYFYKLHYNQTFLAPYEDGWMKTPFAPPPGQPQAVQADLPPTAFHPYPSGYQVPYHFKHPITGE